MYEVYALHAHFALCTASRPWSSGAFCVWALSPAAPPRLLILYIPGIIRYYCRYDKYVHHPAMCSVISFYADRAQKQPRGQGRQEENQAKQKMRKPVAIRGYPCSNDVTREYSFCASALALNLILLRALLLSNLDPCNANPPPGSLSPRQGWGVGISGSFRAYAL